MDALNAADVTVLVLPCGRSAHLEAGYTAGQGKPVVILLDQTFEPELMYKMAPPPLRLDPCRSSR
jgi:nucleoside 2-deoxyribosyltransferase